MLRDIIDRSSSENESKSFDLLRWCWIGKKGVETVQKTPMYVAFARRYNGNVRFLVTCMPLSRKNWGRKFDPNNLGLIFSLTLIVFYCGCYFWLTCCNGNNIKSISSRLRRSKWKPNIRWRDIKPTCIYKIISTNAALTRFVSLKLLLHFFIFVF